MEQWSNREFTQMLDRREDFANKHWRSLEGERRFGILVGSGMAHRGEAGSIFRGGYEVQEGKGGILEATTRKVPKGSHNIDSLGMDAGPVAMTKSVRVHDDTHSALKLLKTKRRSSSLDQVIRELIRESTGSAVAESQGPKSDDLNKYLGG